MPTTSNNDMQFDAKDIAENKVMAALSYIGILVLVPLLAKKDSKFAQANAKQGVVTCIAAILIGWIPMIGWLLAVVIIVVDLIALISVLQGKFWKIPLAYDLSKKLNI